MKIRTTVALVALVAASFTAPYYSEQIANAASGAAKIGPLNALKLAAITNPAAAFHTLAALGAAPATAAPAAVPFEE